MEIWESATVNENDEIELPQEAFKRLVRKYPANATPYLNLSQYYKYISAAMGDKFESEMEPIIFHISSLINGRNLARQTLKKSLKDRNSMVVFNQDNTSIDIESLESIVFAMRSEASALKVKVDLFKTLRV